MKDALPKSSAQNAKQELQASLKLNHVLWKDEMNIKPFGHAHYLDGWRKNEGDV